MAKSLRKQTVRSCGCLRREWASAHASKSFTTHGKTKTPEYRSWCSMVQRCYAAAHVAYPRYGGRGIVICDKWRHSFEAFLADMGQRPTLQHTLERLNNSGNYEPGNCTWGTKIQQARNRRTNRMVTIGGVTLTLIEWANNIGIHYSSLKRRMASWPESRWQIPPTR